MIKDFVKFMWLMEAKISNSRINIIFLEQMLHFLDQIFCRLC